MPMMYSPPVYPDYSNSDSYTLPRSIRRQEPGELSLYYIPIRFEAAFDTRYNNHGAVDECSSSNDGADSSDGRGMHLISMNVHPDYRLLTYAKDSPQSAAHPSHCYAPHYEVQSIHRHSDSCHSSGADATYGSSWQDSVANETLSRARTCTNCHLNHSPSWRRGLAGELLCNACGLYLKLHKSRRPHAFNYSRLRRTRRSPLENVRCQNCSTSDTPMWRRGSNQEPLCNACGLYYRQHKAHRPLPAIAN